MPFIDCGRWFSLLVVCSMRSSVRAIDRDISGHSIEEKRNRTRLRHRWHRSDATNDEVRWLSHYQTLESKAQCFIRRFIATLLRFHSQQSHDYVYANAHRWTTVHECFTSRKIQQICSWADELFYGRRTKMLHGSSIELSEQRTLRAKWNEHAREIGNRDLFSSFLQSWFSIK